MERKKRLYNLILEMKIGAETKNFPRVRKANGEFSQLHNEEFEGQEYIPGTLKANFDRARNNYINSFTEELVIIGYTREQILDEANGYFSQIQKELAIEVN